MSSLFLWGGSNRQSVKFCRIMAESVTDIYEWEEIACKVTLGIRACSLRIYLSESVTVVKGIANQ